LANEPGMRLKIYHTIFWLLVAGVWFYLRYQDYATLQIAVEVSIIKVIDLALLIYFVNLVLVPRLLYTKRYGWFAGAFIASVAITSFIKMLALAKIQHDDLSSFTNVKEKIYNNFVTQFFLVLASIGLKSVFDYLRLQKKMADVAREKAEAELNFLKSQINPHFLFNSLNSVYFLIDKENADARQALKKFSDILRYQLYECNDAKIPIEKEISYLKDYVALQKLRREPYDDVRFTCSENVKGFSIEPLLLMPFVENSFKHLSHFSNGKKNVVEISADRASGQFSFCVANTIEHKSRDPVGGIGLKNVTRRLELLYNGRHELQVQESGDLFKVELKIEI
jgi:two-component system LytT family sensor kinase